MLAELQGLEGGPGAPRAVRGSASMVFCYGSSTGPTCALILQIGA